MNRKIILAGTVLIVIVIIIYSLTGNQDAAYIKEIETIRKEKLNFLVFNPESPIETNLNFASFDFFDVSAKYKVKAALISFDNPGRIKLPTNDGNTRDYVRFSKATFEIDGIKDTLTLYIEPSFNANYKRAFVPFSDKSNGKETYPAGRYLDVEIKSDEFVTLDFNLAYNPYCAYDESFVCPIPPSENSLKINIKAGEKKYDSLH